jgi:hypothetical protein
MLVAHSVGKQVVAMRADDTDALDEQFATLLEQGAAALAAGSPWYPEDNPAIPVPLLPSLKQAQRCLELLHEAWPRCPAGQTTEDATFESRRPRRVGT